MQSSGNQTVSTLYVTNRGRDVDAAGNVTYNGQRGRLQYGTCLVEFTPIPFAQNLVSNAPFYLPKETNRTAVFEAADKTVFWADLVAKTRLTGVGSVVLFIHGYNYGFSRSCRMAAELQRVLGETATVVMASWPSNGRPTDYLRDQVDLEWSVPFLADLIGEVVARVGSDHSQVLAHSMGSRGALFALQRLVTDLEMRPLIRRLTLLAPDFDTDTFVELLPRLAPVVGAVALYASSKDTALATSRRINGHPRLGEAGDYLTVVEGVETIDVSSSGRYQIFGHEYFYYNPWVAADLAELLGENTPATARRSLRARQRDGLSYWEINRED